MKTSHKANLLPTRHPLAQAITLALMFGTGSVQAATFNVTNNTDSGTGSLRQAVVNANAAPGADDIAFDPGLGTITLTSGQIDITETLSITGPAAGQTISGNNTSRILAVTASNQPLSLENLTLTGGYIVRNQTSYLYRCNDTDFGNSGGAVCSISDLTLTNSTVSGNRTNGEYMHGGGLAVIDSNATLINSTVSGNTTTDDKNDNDGHGGGLFVGGYDPKGGNATLTNSIVSGNNTNYGSGGGLYVRGNVTLTDSTVSDNHTAVGQSLGGGIYVRDGDATLINSIVSGNSTAGINASGGGLAVGNHRLEGGDVTLTDSIISANSTTGELADGGGLYLGNGNAMLTNSTVSGNSTAGENAGGGGLYVRDGDATLTNSTVSGNSTTGEYYSYYGSGDYVRNSGGLHVRNGNAVLTNSTVTNNHAITGAGGIDFHVHSSYSLTLVSTVVAANTGPSGNVGLPRASTVDASFSLLGDLEAEINGSNSNNVFTDTPDLAPLADNGCAVPAGAPDSATCVQTHALLADSPALNSGDNPLALASDQRGEGFARVLDGTTDIGAFEGIVTVPDKIGVYLSDDEQGFYLDADGNGLWDGTPNDVIYEFGIEGKPIAGDWNGDGTDEIGVYHPDQRRFYLDLNGNGLWDGAPIDASYAFGITGKPVIGDWNGDGRDEIGIYRLGQRQFYLDLNGNGLWDGTGGDVAYSFGIAGKPVVGDWNGDGADKIGIYNTDAKGFYLDLNGNGVWDGVGTAADTNYRFGIGGKPIIGDWNGDGIDKIGVYRAEAGKFFFDLNGNGVWDGDSNDASTVFGIGDDEADAVIGKW